MPNDWQFIDSGFHPGEENMRADLALAEDLQRGSGVPALRLYGWRPWAISLGYNQDPADLDRDQCARDGIDIVRRPTGGRAILHAEELTYCVVMNAGRGSILQVYNEISRALVLGLRHFGLEVSLQKSQPNFQVAYRHASSIPCFTSSARYEIEWRGRKLVGSAQRRFADGGNDVVLQHGSILCGPAHRRLADYLALKDGAVISQLRDEMQSKTVDLAEAMGKSADISALVDCIRRGFEEAWGVRFNAVAQDAHAESGT